MRSLSNTLCAAFCLAAALAGGPARAEQSVWATSFRGAPSAPGLPLRLGAPAAPTTGEVVVRFRDAVPMARWAQLVGATGSQILRADADSGYALVQPRDHRAGDLMAFLGRRAEVLHAEPCYLLHVLDQSYYDPYEWYLFDHGTTSAQAVSNFGIQAASAWTHTKGAGITVAVVDSGVAFEDYSPYYQAPALSNTQFTTGYNVLDPTASAHPNDTNGHGTLVTGVLAGNLVNGGGVLGVAPEATVMPVRVIESDGSGRDIDIAEGIRWAADNGASVINLSLGGPQAGSVLADAVNYAASQDCVVVAASGNDIPPQNVAYPAAYSNCIAVGATAFDGARCPYSDYGRNLELVAPGGNLNEDLNGDGAPDGIVAQTFDPTQGFDSFSYQPVQGTSFSSPMVAGVAALVRAANPALAALDVRLILRNTAMPLGSPTPRNNYYGYGLVDAKAAVEAALAQKAGGQ